jgi:IS4 transposase
LGLIEKLRRVAEKVHVIGMYKYNSNSKLTVDGKEMSIKQLRKHRGKMSRSRAIRLYYFQYIGEIDGVQVKVFLTKRGVNGAWHTLLSTDTGLSFYKAIKVYNTRWTIEVFFKEAKQLLGLGKSQSTNFDVQVSQTNITMIQYLMISLKYRMEAYETIGGMFREIKQNYIEHKLNERLLSAISEILSVFK